MSIEERIREQAEDISIPDSLKPEQIEKLVEETRKKKRRKIKSLYGGVAVAACCALVVGLFAWRSQRESTREITQETTTVNGYKEIFSYIEAEQEHMKNSNTEESILSFESATDSMAKTTESSGAAQSVTNTREAGVEEGDIVKTDGKNLYLLNGQQVKIVNVEQEKMKELATIEVDEDESIVEIYLNNNRLIIIYSHIEFLDEKGGYGSVYQNYTVAETFDVSNPESPISVGEIRQSGNYNTLRVKDNYVYLLSDFYINALDVKESKKEMYIPAVQDKLLTADNILLPSYKGGNQYTVVTSFSLANPEETVDSKAVFGSAGLVYASTDNIYICEAIYNSDESDVTETCIRKVSFEMGKLQSVGYTRVDGVLNDAFSIDEYEGNLRLVTTVSSIQGGGAMPIVTLREKQEQETVEDSNSLYILDKDLNELGKIEEIAVGEQVYSARFMGDIGYFVTFKQVDPLFSVDLSNPKKPTILGALKIPGFSEYLHPYEENLLLGIGMDVDPTGVSTNGVKLSMFDTSNAGDVREVQKHVLKEAHSAEVFYNYKAAYISPDKTLFGFTTYGNRGQKYYLFSYNKENGFQTVFEKVVNDSQRARGVSVGKTFYLVVGNTIESYHMNGFNKVEDMVL